MGFREILKQFLNQPQRALSDPGRAIPEGAVVSRIPGDKTKERTAAPPRIDIRGLPYVPLPRAPSSWETTHAAPVNGKAPTDQLIAIDRAPDWRISGQRSLPMGERPDPAYRKLRAAGTGTFLLADRGKAKEFPGAPSALLSFDRLGHRRAGVGTAHDFYRVETNPLGRGIIGMSGEGVVHAYNEDLIRVLEVDLKALPQVLRAQATFFIDPTVLRRYIRSAAISRDCTGFLFTVVDQVWRCNLNGEVLWGAAMPIAEGWEAVGTSADCFGTSAEVLDGLCLLGLALPTSPEQIKARYRTLAKELHPDVNPNDPQATAKFQRLSAAVQLLTGQDPRTFLDVVGEQYFKPLHRSSVRVNDEVAVEFSIGMGGGPCEAADWIYAANFGGWTDNVFVASYSGRVVVIDANGVPLRAYDIGAVPRRIADTGDYLYLLTDTRLYVLSENRLCALIDTSEAGDLVVGETGFGFLGGSRFDWYTEAGARVGGVRTKHPIRRVYFSLEGLVIETRQHQFVVSGAPPWWLEGR